MSSLKRIPGIEQVTLTTNGIRLQEFLQSEAIQKRESCIDGINISLDAVDRKKYAFLTGVDGLKTVLSAIDAAAATGVRVKINAVCVDFSRLGFQNADRYEEIRALAELAKDREIFVRFIEIMPIGYGRNFPGIPHSELIPYMFRRYPGMVRDTSVYGNGPAVYYAIEHFKGRIGFISAICEGFCDSCNRLRLTADGFLKSCLCYDTGVDLRAILRSGESDEKPDQAVRDAIMAVIRSKPGEHSFLTGKNITEKKTMAAIGG